MSVSQQRKDDLKDHLEKDFALLKDLEDKERFEDNPQKKGKLSSQIDDVTKRIDKYKIKLSLLEEEAQQQNISALMMSKITYTELDTVTNNILSMPLVDTECNLAILIPPSQKIARNQLSIGTTSKLQIGLIKAKEVKKFVEHMATIIPEFPDKLKAGLVIEYERLRQEGLEGDKLFDSLHDFASRQSSDYLLQTAGLAVVSYFFESCDLFET